MPEPDPTPPQPRPISAARWLSLLLPAVVAMAYPLVNQIIRSLNIRIRIGGDSLSVLVLGLALATMLSFVLGCHLEKLRWGTVRNGFRAFRFGFLILIVNTFVAFAGCTAFTGVFKAG